MYLPKHFDAPSQAAMHAVMQARPLATVVTLSHSGLDANHIPLHFVKDSGPFGTLRGHVARANPMWKEFDKNTEALSIFHGPDSYITPAWYATKKTSGKVVPTWNYVVVRAYGHLCIREDESWLRSQLEALTDHNEAVKHEPWKITDAPHDYIENLTKAIVGFEIVITRLSGKWKVSQNQSEQNQVGVANGLKAEGHRDADWLAALIAENNSISSVDD